MAITAKNLEQATIIAEHIKQHGLVLDRVCAEQLMTQLGLKDFDSLRSTLYYLRSQGLKLPKIKIITGKFVSKTPDRPLKENQGQLDMLCPRCRVRKGWAVWLTYDDTHGCTYCAQCGWYEGWELTLCSGI